MMPVKKMSDSSGHLKELLINPFVEKAGIKLERVGTWDKQSLIYELTKSHGSFLGGIFLEGERRGISLAYCSYFPNDRIDPSKIISVEEAIIKSEISSMKLTLGNMPNRKGNGRMQVYDKSSNKILTYDFTQGEINLTGRFIQKIFLNHIT